MKYRPYDYQANMTEFIVKNKKNIVMLDIGMGRNSVLLAALYKIKYDYFEEGKIIIVSSKYRAENVWPAELVQWEPMNNMRWSLVRSDNKKRLCSLKIDADIYIIGYENAMWIIENGLWDFNTVVIDEISAYKNDRSKRYSAMKKVVSEAERFIGLAGNPLLNNIADIWSLIFLIDAGKRLGRTKNGFYERYFFNTKLRKGVYKRELKRGALEAISNAISDVCISYNDKSDMKVPEYICNTQYVSMDASQISKYKWLESEMMLQFTNSLEIESKSISALSTKLLQMANGAVYDSNKKVHILHDKKIQALKSYIESAKGQHIMIAYWFQHDKQRILEEFQNARVIENIKDIREWNMGKIPLALMNPAMGDDNLKLCKGGHILVWFSMTWSLELYDRMIKRFLGEEQKATVMVHHIITEKTIDVKVMEALAKKKKLQDILLNSINKGGGKGGENKHRDNFT